MVLSGISQYAIVLHSIVGYCIGCTVLHGIEGYFIVLHHVASYQMVLPSIVTQYCRVIDGIVLWCMVLHVVCGMLWWCMLLYGIAWYNMLFHGNKWIWFELNDIACYCIVLYCIVLYCIVLCYIVLYIVFLKCSAHCQTAMQCNEIVHNHI